MTDASVHAKQIFRRWIVNAPSSGQQPERRGSSGERWMTGCFKANSGGNPGTAVYKLEPPTLCFNALESSTANTRAVPSWHRGWHRFCWHGDRPLLEKEAFSLPWPEKSCCTSSTGHAVSCVTLDDIVSVGSKSGSDPSIIFWCFFFFFISWNSFCCNTKQIWRHGLLKDHPY